MKRKDREITDRGEMEAVLAAAPVCRMAMADGEEPYVVPLCFGYADNTIWVHSAREGKKIDILTRNPRCCVEVDMYEGPIRDTVPCSWEVRYKSVICTGFARPVEDSAEKNKALTCIMQHYGGETPVLSEKALDRVLVVKIAIEEMTGKKYGY